jgi:hypothetical protein
LSLPRGLPRESEAADALKAQALRTMERKGLENGGAEECEVADIVNTSFVLEILDNHSRRGDGDEHWQGGDDQEKKGGT